MNLHTETAAINRPMLPKAAKVLLWIIGFNSLGNSLSNIFINVYWLKITQDVSETLMFNWISYLAWLPAFAAAGWLSKKAARSKALWIGSLLQVLFYVAVLGLGERSANWLEALGVLYGVGSGFYWLAANVLTVDVTRPANRDWFNGLNGIFGSLSGMFGPLLAGWVVAVMPGFAGYTTIFVAAFLCFLLSLLASFLLPADSVPGAFEWRRMLGVWKKQREWRQISWAFVFISFREGVLSIVIWLWIYMATGSENTTGNYAFVTTFLSVVVFYLIGRYGQERHRWLFLTWGTTLLSLSLIGITVHLNPWTLMLFAVLDAVSKPMFNAPFFTISYNAVSRHDLKGQIRVELMVWRELALSVGRIASVGLLVWLYKATDPANTLSWFLLAVIAAGVLPVYFLRTLFNRHPSSYS
ncbi:MFS transporter [Paenibacillus beijingensis]|uniref:MFS transporter n=1 Tax=Paenibacillus beijingensis TaxID=1126833 RepID=A0A0D5NET0_9BACL|nr:MFS transporter [Paenibacillus beijingensis]AJY73487.1 hypothetical protein VN24_01170 [Paenibacillus beijingensis]